MNWELVLVIWNFFVEMYHAGGAQVRWVVWIWCAFIFLYVLLGIYDSIHKQSIIKQRKKEEKNYFYALHVYGILTIAIEYGYLLGYWDIYVPIVEKSLNLLITIVGFGILLFGFIFVLLGRLYLNSFWGKDIYSYEEKDKYKLVKENVYSKCRHPIYFGQVCMCFGTALVLNNWIIVIFAGLMLIMNWYRAKREDAYLHKCFGEEWETYERQVNFLSPIP